VDAYFAGGEDHHLEIAIRAATFILKNMKQADGGLFRNYKHGKASISGFLEDYAFVARSFIQLYEATADEAWIMEAKKFADYTLAHFYDEKAGMFYFTSDKSNDLVTRKMEITDNVIPASNSVMANALFDLSLFFEYPQYHKVAGRMLHQVEEHLSTYPSAFTNWGILHMKFTHPYSTFVFTGPEAVIRAHEVQRNYLPDVILAAAKSKSELPLFADRFNSKETTIYVCFGNTCKLPVHGVDKALKLLEDEKSEALPKSID